MDNYQEDLIKVLKDKYKFEEVKVNIVVDKSLNRSGTIIISMTSSQKSWFLAKTNGADKQVLEYQCVQAESYVSMTIGMHCMNSSKLKFYGDSIEFSGLIIVLEVLMERIFGDL